MVLVDKNNSKAEFMRFAHIDMSFEKKKILNDISLTIEEGEFIGLIGPNGAGKSTLLKIILGLLKPTSGEITVNGSDLKNLSEGIGYVPQKLHIDTLTPLRGRDLVALGLDGNHWGIPLPNKRKKNKIDKILKAVDALDFADNSVGKLSGGELQRLLIAQALVSDPKILLLDEPLSNLDIKSAYEVVDLVSKICKERKITVIFVTHDMNPLINVMDRVIYLAKGNAIIGKINDIFQNDVLSSLYGYKIEVIRTHGRLLVVGNNSDPSYLSP